MNFFPFASVYEVDGPKVVKDVVAESINLLEHLPYFGATLKNENISTTPLTTINEKQLPKAIKYAFNTKGSMFYQRLPNFIATDNYTSDSFLFALCNICNSLSPEQREKLFGKNSVS